MMMMSRDDARGMMPARDAPWDADRATCCSEEREEKRETLPVVPEVFHLLLL